MSLEATSSPRSSWSFSFLGLKCWVGLLCVCVCVCVCVYVYVLECELSIIITVIINIVIITIIIVGHFQPSSQPTFSPFPTDYKEARPESPDGDSSERRMGIRSQKKSSVRGPAVQGESSDED